MKRCFASIAASGLLLAAGCSHRAPEVIRQAEFLPITVEQARTNPGQFENSRVRWGGTLVEVENRERATLIEILSRPLKSDGYPDADKAAGPRFLARVADFVDPAEYAPDRLVTVVGRITGATEAPIGEFIYRYVLTDAEVVHLWPIPAPEPCCPGYPWYGPWYDPWYHPWYYPGWRKPYW